MAYTTLYIIWAKLSLHYTHTYTQKVEVEPYFKKLVFRRSSIPKSSKTFQYPHGAVTETLQYSTNTTTPRTAKITKMSEELFFVKTRPEKGHFRHRLFSPTNWRLWQRTIL